MVNFRNLTDNNAFSDDNDIIKLEVYSHQRDFAAPNVEALAEAYVGIINGVKISHAIYHSDTLAGLVIYTYDDDDSLYCLWHLMIDKNHQGKGYAKKAVEMVLDEIRTRPFGEAKNIVVHYEHINDAARGLYASFGFVETGEAADDKVSAILEI